MVFQQPWMVIVLERPTTLYLRRQKSVLRARRDLNRPLGATIFDIGVSRKPYLHNSYYYAAYRS